MTSISVLFVSHDSHAKPGESSLKPSEKAGTGGTDACNHGLQHERYMTAVV